MLMGLIIEKVSGKNLHEFSKENIFEPLNMTRTTFDPELFGKETIPPTEIEDWRGLVQGVPHDESTFTLQSEGYYLGVAGLFSTVPDLLKVLETILNRKEFLSNELIDQMFTNQIEDLGDKTGLGWQMKKREWPYMGNYSSENSIGQNGYTGCFVMCDKENDVVIAMLSNRTFPKRPPNGDAINKVRADLVDIVYKNL